MKVVSKHFQKNKKRTDPQQIFTKVITKRYSLTRRKIILKKTGDKEGVRRTK